MNPRIFIMISQSFIMKMDVSYFYHLTAVLCFIIVDNGYVCNARTPGSLCSLPEDAVNRILASTVEEETFSVEPVLAMAISPGENIDYKEIIEYIREKNPPVNLSDINWIECLSRYEASFGIPDHSGQRAGGGPLDYNRPHYLGGVIPIPVPIPDDENYLPPAEGYSTYINPYDFANKVPEYKPFQNDEDIEDDDSFDWNWSNEEESTDKNKSISASTTEKPDKDEDYEYFDWINFFY